MCWGAVLQVGGVRFGLEVCLDHAERKLKRQVSDRQAVDVHLITSAGMSVQPESVVGRIALHCDGLANASSTQHGAHSTAFVRIDGSSRLDKVTPLASVDAHGAGWQRLLDGLYVTGFGPPRLSIYPAIAL